MDKTYLPYQQRVIDEKAELDERCTKLAAFFETAMCNGLPPEEQCRMVNQHNAMSVYSVILGERIAAF